MRIPKNSFVVIIAIVLAIVPFFWLKPGEMDLGGDASRLYFYDPGEYLKNYSLYNIVLFGSGIIEPHFYNFSIVAFILFVKSFLGSPTFVIALFNSFKLVGGFLSVYAIVKVLINEKGKYWYTKELSAIFAGLFYIFYPLKPSEWDRSLLNHNQIFINPLIFYLLLKLFLTRNTIYLWLTILITFIFANNFAWVSAPPFFAFYPLALLFLSLYVFFIRRFQIPIKQILIGLIFFIGLHAFHLFPSISSLFDPSSNVSFRVFNKGGAIKQLDYFYGILPLASLANAVFLPVKFGGAIVISLAPIIVVWGFLVKGGRKTMLILTSLFFLLTLFLLTAKVSYITQKFYALLFVHVPGFTMFRTFIQQWIYVSSFFYALLFGQALYIISKSLKEKYVFLLAIIAGFLIFLSSWGLLKGDFVNKSYTFAPQMKSTIIMSQEFEKVLSFIRSLPEDAKLMIFPITDYNYHLFRGQNGGVYLGSAPIPFLTGKEDFPGYWEFKPFDDVFLRLAKEKDYASIKRLTQLLNIKYILYNSDEKIYNKEYFPGLPYDTVRQFLPPTQAEYQIFIDNLRAEKIFEEGSYSIHTIDTTFVPHISIAVDVRPYDNPAKIDGFGKSNSFFEDDADFISRSAYIDRNICPKLFEYQDCEKAIFLEQKELPKIKFQKINPTKYNVSVSNIKGPFVLIFSQTFHPGWKLVDPAITNKNLWFEEWLGDVNKKQTQVIKNENKVLASETLRYFDGQIEEQKGKNIFLNPLTFETWGKRTIADRKHFKINGYANAWYIEPADFDGKTEYSFILELTQQKLFYVSLELTILSLIGFLVWGGFLLVRCGDPYVQKKSL